MPNTTAVRTLAIALASPVGLYVAAYCVARLQTFHTVEYYPAGKGGPRADYITKRGLPPGTGWEYQTFRPAIAVEEAILYRRNNP